MVAHVAELLATPSVHRLIESARAVLGGKVAVGLVVLDVKLVLLIVLQAKTRGLIRRTIDIE